MNYTFMSEYSLYHILKDVVSHEITEHLGGPHIVVKYPNGYGASIVKNNISHGHNVDLWELAVLHNGEITYGTYLTYDVIGYLDDSEVESLCETIRGLSEDEDLEDLADEWFEEYPEDYWLAMEDEDEGYDGEQLDTE